jgi:Zn-dependent M16 (insulinase) family peptidase
MHAAKGPDTFDHVDLPALRVLTEYLTTMEGLFWKQVRGNGLAYGANIRLACEAGTRLCFDSTYR